MIGLDKCMMVIHIEVGSWKCWLVFSGKNHVANGTSENFELGNCWQPRSRVTGYLFNLVRCFS